MHKIIQSLFFDQNRMGLIFLMGKLGEIYVEIKQHIHKQVG